MGILSIILDGSLLDPSNFPYDEETLCFISFCGLYLFFLYGLFMGLKWYFVRKKEQKEGGAPEKDLERDGGEVE